MKSRRTLAIVGGVTAISALFLYAAYLTVFAVVTAINTPVAQPAEAEVPTLSYVAPPRTKPDVGQLYMGVNTERQNAGLQPLTVNHLLETSACAKAEDMIAKNYWSHDSPDGTGPMHYITLTGYDYLNAGENLAYGYPDADKTVAGWMSSQGHRENILGDYTQMGMCVTDFADYQGGNYSVVVNHFGRPL